MRATILAALAIGPMFAETHTVYAERYYSSFHNRHAVLKRIRPGDTVKFQRVSLEEAHQLVLAREHVLAMLREGLAGKFH